MGFNSGFKGLTSAPEVSGQPYLPTPGIKTLVPTGQEVGWRELRGREVRRPAGGRTPDRPALSPLAILSGVCLKLNTFV